jgi:ornithine carbamoyltransferase
MALFMVPTSRAERGLLGHDLVAEMDLNIGQWRGLFDLVQELRSYEPGPGASVEPVVPTIALLSAGSAGVGRTSVAGARARIETAAQLAGIEVRGVQWLGEHVSGVTLGDLGRRLGRGVDGIATVGLASEEVRLLADAASVPVWNGLSDHWHPLGVLGDLVTMVEAAGIPAEQIAVAFVGPAESPTANSLLIAGAMFGLELRMVVEEGDTSESDEQVLAAARGIGALTGARLWHADSLTGGVAGADFVYDGPGGGDLSCRIPGVDAEAFRAARERNQVEAVRAVLVATLGSGRV